MAENKTENRRKLYLAALLFLITLILYSPSLFNGFAYDDHFLIINNPWIKNFSYIREILFSHQWAFRDTVSNYYRPTFHLIGIIEHSLFGLRPWGFHLTSVVIHAINVVLVFLVASTLFPKKERPEGSPNYIHITPFLGALIFAVHTVNSDVINWISAISDLLFTFFYLAAFYLYIKASRDDQGFLRRPVFYISLFLYFLALFSKETAVTFLIFIFAYDFSTGAKIFTKRSLVYLPYILVTIFYLLIRNYSIGGMIETQFEEITFFQALLNIAPLTIDYMEKLIIPINITVVHSVKPVLSPAEPRFIITTLLSLMILGAAFYFYFKKKRMILFTLLWIFIPLIVVLYYPVISGGFSERYLYLSSAAYALLFAKLIEWAINRANKSQNRKVLIRVSAAAVVIALTTLYVYGTVKRTYIWKSDFSLWSETIRTSPDNAIAHDALGTAYMIKGDNKQAFYHAKESVRLDPGAQKPRINLGNALTKFARFDEAITEYKIVLEMNPSNSDALYDYALALAKTGRLKEAEQAFLKTIELNPLDTKSRNNLGNIYMMRNDSKRAEALYIEAIEIDPGQAHALNNMGLLMARKREYEKSLEYFQRAINADPNYKDAHFNKELTLKLLGRK